MSILGKDAASDLLGSSPSEGRPHVLHQGDVRDLLSQLSKSSVQLIVTSPPYNIGKEYETPTSLEKYLDAQNCGHYLILGIDV